jgi:hypothetical protein
MNADTRKCAARISQISPKDKILFHILMTGVLSEHQYPRLMPTIEFISSQSAAVATGKDRVSVY